MRPGLFTATSAMVDNADRMETIVHNLANANTVGYKKHIAISVPFTRFLDEVLDDVEGVGGEMFPKQKIRYCYSDGATKYTGRNLDVALQDDRPASKKESCCFFSVLVPQRTVEQPRQYNVDREFYLVEAAGPDGREGGKRVTAKNGGKIQFPPGTDLGSMYVDNDGGVYVGDLLVAEIKDPTVKAVIDPAVQYTRRGDFHIKVEGDDQAYLVSVDGFHVQGQGGSISFPKQTTPDQIIIDTRGRVFLDQGPKKKMKQIDQLRISKMTDIDFKGKLKFSLDEHNFVVTPRGRPIHDIHGHFILAPEGTGSIDVTPDGRVMADGLEIARTWERPGKVQRGEDEPVVVQTRFGYYVPADEFVAVNDVACNVHQCNLEQSNVNVISELGQMIITMRSFEADARLLQAMEQNLRLVTNPNA